MALPKLIATVGEKENISNKGGFTKLYAVPFAGVNVQPPLIQYDSSNAATSITLLTMQTGDITLKAGYSWSDFEMDIESGKIDTNYVGDPLYQTPESMIAFRIPNHSAQKLAATRARIATDKFLLVFRLPDQNYGGEVSATYSPWRVLGDKNVGYYAAISTNNGTSGEGVKGKNMVEITFTCNGLEPYIYQPTGGIFPPPPPTP